MEKRIRIINSFNSHFGKRNNSIDQRLRTVQILQYFNALVILLTVVVILNSLFPSSYFALNLEWKNSVLLVLVSLNYILNTDSLFYESKLLKHLKTIHSETIVNENEQQLNKELYELLHKQNKNNKLKIFILIWTGIMLFVALLHFLTKDTFTYWNYFKIPFLVLIVLAGIDFIIKFRKLQENIKEYEAG